MSLARPVSAKEPYIYTKRALCTCKRASYTHQKLLLMSLARRVSAKEPYVYTKRAVYMQKSLTYTPEVALEGLCKRALNINQKSFIYTPKELYIYPKRALYIHPKSPIYTPKEP